MRKNLSCALLFLAIITSNISIAQETFRFEGQVKGIKDTTCMLAYYYGDKQYAKDTADIDNDGRFFLVELIHLTMVCIWLYYLMVIILKW